MSVAAESTPDWKQWEAEIVDGQFPLERFLGAGKEGAVFLTHVASGDAAIRLAPAGNGKTNDLVERWSRAASLDHPHLLRILAVGTWIKEGTPLAYVVTEYAEENLATVLAERALSSDEVLAMLPPIADAMAFLHDRGYVLGNLKPSHVYAVHDIVKISSDAVAPGDTAADLQALAATITRALTRKPIEFTNEVESGVVESLPEPIREITRRCLGKDGRSRWSAAELARWLRGEPSSDPVISKPVPADTPTADTQLATAKPKRTSFVIVLALALLAVIAVSALLRNRTAAPAPVVLQPAPKAIATSPSSAPIQPPPEANASTATPTGQHAATPERPSRRAQVLTQDQIVEQVLPDIPVKALHTIHGKPRVVIKAIVNQSGDVTDAIVQPGGSPYFGRLAAQAVRKWRFVSSSVPSREYSLRFEITQSGPRAVIRKAAESQ